MSNYTHPYLEQLDVENLVKTYGSPLYIYHEGMFRERLREIKSLLPYAWFKVNASIKANSNLELLKIAREEGIDGDAVSAGEIFILEKAGFEPDRIFFIGNNISIDEMKIAVDKGIVVSIDSLSQLETFGQYFKGGKVSIRFNPGVGAGHHEKVITAGSKTKFGVQNNQIEAVKEIASRYSIHIAGVNQHIGSLFMDGEVYLKGTEALLKIAESFENLEFIDIGGGLGIPYKRSLNEKRLDLKGLSQSLEPLLLGFMERYGREVQIKVEPGRYLFAECGVLLGTVHAVKTNYDKCYIGTDIGFNVLMRPVLYDAWHELVFFRNGELQREAVQEANVVGNICETGDYLAKDRLLPLVEEGDIMAVLDAGAYCYSMSSNYNQRLRPAEVLIDISGKDRLIRRRDRYEDLLANYF